MREAKEEDEGKRSRSKPGEEEEEDEEVVAKEKKKGLAEFHSRHFYSATIAAKAFRALLREVEKYPSIVGFQPGTMALIANVLTNFAERSDFSELSRCLDAKRILESG